MKPANWQEVESRVHPAGKWFPIVLGALFLSLGLAGLWHGADLVPADKSIWWLKACIAGFAILGAFTLGVGLKQRFWPTYIRHASPDVLPEVPDAPILVEGARLYGSLTHELIETFGEWQFRPKSRLLRGYKYFLLCFGVPFSILFVAILSSHFHNDLKINSWPIAVLLAVGAIAVSGGTVIAILSWMWRASHLQLACLRIPKAGTAKQAGNPQKQGPDKALDELVSGKVSGQPFTIPHESVIAVQLCPWKFVLKRSGETNITWAVQGLLVYQLATEQTSRRMPILLTSDLYGAARLMQQLAQTLRVPFLFSADSEGWKRESLRAKARLPLVTGEIV